MRFMEKKPYKRGSWKRTPISVVPERENPFKCGSFKRTSISEVPGRKPL